MSAVGAVFNTGLRPRLEMICATSDASAERYRAAYGFARATSDWRELVADPRVEAVVIASPQSTHREIAEAAFARGLPVLCEKPLGATLEDSRAMVDAAEVASAINMVGFNYIRTPASQFARQLIADGALGQIISFRGEHTEDFLSDPDLPGNWRTEGVSNGNMVYAERGGVPVTNDDQAHILCRFESGVLGTIFSSRVSTGRKMGYAYEITGSKGAIRFDQEDQNAIWLYKAEGPEAERGFTKILTGPAHPDYQPFCLGPGHGTGYQDQIIIEAKDFLTAIETGKNMWPTFRDGMEVNRIVKAALVSSEEKRWIDVDTI